jgi:asparagine N-glycosylation enzyme membrane subunit Stt3
VLFLACWGISYLGLAIVRRRFAPYFTIPMALLAWEGLCFAAAVAVRRAWPGRPRVAAALAWMGAAAVVAPSVRDLAEPAPRQQESHLKAMRWLGSQSPPEAREGILGPWALGHLILYYARKPVVVSPFGTEGGGGAMQFAAQVNLSRDPGDAERLLLGRRIGYVVVGDPLRHALVDQGFAPAGTPAMVRRACSVTEGATLEVDDEYASRLAPRLYYFDGLSRAGELGGPADGFRLVYETPGAEERLKIFEIVSGARLTVTGARPSGPVFVAARVRTNQGRELVWNVAARADRSGSAHVRLPYATGHNGAVEATVWSVSDGASTTDVATSESDVLQGRSVDVRLGALAP